MSQVLFSGSTTFSGTSAVILLAAGNFVLQSMDWNIDYIESGGAVTAPVASFVLEDETGLISYWSEIASVGGTIVANTVYGKPNTPNGFVDFKDLVLPRKAAGHDSLLLQMNVIQNVSNARIVTNIYGLNLP